MAFTYVTITADYDTADGLDPSGSVTFTPSAALVNSGVINIAAPVTRRVDVDGVLSISLAANTDPGTTPTNSYYTVIEQLNDTTRTYLIRVPYNSGSPLGLATLVVTS